MLKMENCKHKFGFENSGIHKTDFDFKTGKRIPLDRKDYEPFTYLRCHLCGLRKSIDYKNNETLAGFELYGSALDTRPQLIKVDDVIEELNKLQND